MGWNAVIKPDCHGKGPEGGRQEMQWKGVMAKVTLSSIFLLVIWEVNLHMLYRVGETHGHLKKY